MVRGLSLPPGVNNYSLADCDGSSGVYDSEFGQVRRILLVGFACPQGWDSVVSHTDACMAAEGFVSCSDGLERAALQVDPRKPVPLGTMVRCYRDAQRRRAVLLVNNAGIKLAVAAFDPGLPVPRSRFVSSNDYALTVIQYK